MADLAPQANGLQVKALHEFHVRGEECVQSTVWIAAFGDNSHPMHDSADVGIGGKHGLAEREQKDDPGGLWPHTWDAEQPRHRVVSRSLAEEVEIERAALVTNTRKRRLNGSGFLLLKTPGADHRLDLPNGRIGDGFQRGESSKEGGVRSIPIRVGRVLRKDREHERLDRIRERDIERAIGRGESVSDPTEQRGVVHGSARIGGDARPRNSHPASAIDTMPPS